MIIRGVTTFLLSRYYILFAEAVQNLHRWIEFTYLFHFLNLCSFDALQLPMSIGPASREKACCISLLQSKVQRPSQADLHQPKPIGNKTLKSLSPRSACFFRSSYYFRTHIASWHVRWMSAFIRSKNGPYKNTFQQKSSTGHCRLRKALECRNCYTDWHELRALPAIWTMFGGLQLFRTSLWTLNSQLVGLDMGGQSIIQIGRTKKIQCLTPRTYYFGLLEAIVIILTKLISP